MKLFPRVFPRVEEKGESFWPGSLRECFNGKLITTEAFLIQQDERMKGRSSRYETSSVIFYYYVNEGGRDGRFSLGCKLQQA